MQIDKQSAIIGATVLVGSAATQYVLYQHVDWAYTILMAIVFIMLAPYLKKKK
ncbi:hypothetical protein [Desulforamulus ferrireducens]|uniref:hypothetical protein n=1 Tax=Desulforamulus ferrireducens TaxID=1833852 RepID=UPI0013564132|nr:hypothetical protein [Desulforamulus ferrireducens]